MMNLMTFLHDLGVHLGGWRHRDAWDKPIMNLQHAIHLAQTAERGLFDVGFLADGNAVRQMDRPSLFAASSPSDRPAVFEPLTLLSALSMHTSRIGLAATATTTYESPYLLARKYASLDHLSGGRAAWNVVTGSYPGDSRNFGIDDHMARADRYEKAKEFVDVCKGLWDSWADDAFPTDKETGQFLRPDRVKSLNHDGKYFKVAGPLNVARSPQGYPVLAMAGQSPAGRDLAAYAADCVFAITATKTEAIAFRNDMRSRASAYGRDPNQIKILPGAAIYVADTENDAKELFEELGSLISVDVGVEYLSKLLETDLSLHPVDGPLPDIIDPTNAIQSFRDSIYKDAKNRNLTIRQTYQAVLPSMGHVVFSGSPEVVAQQMEDWYRGGACDGFNLSFPVLPSGLEKFVNDVVPILQKMGIFRTAYEGKTTREIMGLSLPVRR